MCNHQSGLAQLDIAVKFSMDMKGHGFDPPSTPFFGYLNSQPVCVGAHNHACAGEKKIGRSSFNTRLMGGVVHWDL